MDESTAAQWSTIVNESVEDQRQVPDRVLAMLRSLGTMTVGFAVDQLTHSLQTASRAEADGADDELVVASLCHDVGKAISIANHPRIAAEILRPYVRDEVAQVIAVHQDFQGRHYYAYLGMDPEAREQHRGAPWFDLAARFADDWDQNSFDPDGPIPPLEHFAPLVRAVFARAHRL